MLIDRGDLSKDIKIENIPIAQRDLFRIKSKMPKPFEMAWAFKTTTNQKILCILLYRKH